MKDTGIFLVLYIVSLFCAWNITTVEINSGVYLLSKLNPPSAFVYFRWSWSWSCYFGFGLDLVSSGLGLSLGLLYIGFGLKNLVLFTHT